MSNGRATLDPEKVVELAKVQQEHHVTTIEKRGGDKVCKPSPIINILKNSGVKHVSWVLDGQNTGSDDSVAYEIQPSGTKKEYGVFGEKNDLPDQSPGGDLHHSPKPGQKKVLTLQVNTDEAGVGIVTFYGSDPMTSVVIVE
jgi:hypothetical protein